MEWTRSDLKTKAKDFLRTRYWYAFLVTWIAGMLGGAGSGGGSGGFTSTFGDQDFSGIPPALWIIIGVLAVLGAAFGIAFTLFVGGPVTIGMDRWFSRTREGEEASRIGLLFSLFRRGSYLKSVGAYAWMTLWGFVWSLPSVAAFSAAGVLLAATRIETGSFDLVPMGIASVLLAVGFALLIPAIMRSYAYRLTPWILADNPGIGHRRALRLSIAMSDGHKAGMFVLDLSFLGWYLLGFLACCVGVLFVTPYVVATWAELYATLKASAVALGHCTAEELGYARAEAPSPALPQEGSPA